MEEQGIGRPSTYAPTVSTILDREYVVKEGKYLRITTLGRGGHRPDEGASSRDIADLKFTANMEEKLDDVEEGADPLEGACCGSSTATLSRSLKQAEKDLDGHPHQGARRGQSRRSAP